MISKIPHHEIPRFSLSDVKNQKKHPVTVLVHNVRSLYNVGSVFRTADAAGIEKVILCGYTGRPPRKEIDKTALGSTESVEWEYVADIKEAIAGCRQQGMKIAALEIAKPSLAAGNLSGENFPLALIIGNEITGVDDDVLELCDFAIEIPQYGYKQSLNVSVAFGVGVFGIIDRYRQVVPEEELPAMPTIPPDGVTFTDNDID